MSMLAPVFEMLVKKFLPKIDQALCGALQILLILNYYVIGRYSQVFSGSLIPKNYYVIWEILASVLGKLDPQKSTP